MLKSILAVSALVATSTALAGDAKYLCEISNPIIDINSGRPVMLENKVSATISLVDEEHTRVMLPLNRRIVRLWLSESSGSNPLFAGMGNYLLDVGVYESKPNGLAGQDLGRAVGLFAQLDESLGLYIQPAEGKNPLFFISCKRK